MRAAAFDYHAPSSIEEALLLLSEFGEQARLLAGGQSLVPAMVARLARPGHVIDLNRLPRAERPTSTAARLKIPPLMRHIDFEALWLDDTLAAVMAMLARQVGTFPVRLRGTFCGALANADPAAHWSLATVVLDAQMVARSRRRGIRAIAASDFFESIMATTLCDDEMLVEVQIPLLGALTRYGFDACIRSAGAYPLALALALYEREDGLMRNVRLGVGGIEPFPRRFQQVEAVLEGGEPSDERFLKAADAVADLVEPALGPADDGLHRKDLARAVALRALQRSVDGRSPPLRGHRHGLRAGGETEASPRPFGNGAMRLPLGGDTPVRAIDEDLPARMAAG